MKPPTVLTELFAFLGGEQQLERIGGGSETDVYRTTSAEYVIKLKEVANNGVESALAQASSLRDTARQFTHYLGDEHSIANYFLIASDGSGKIYTVTIQPYLHPAASLATVSHRPPAKPVA